MQDRGRGRVDELRVLLVEDSSDVREVFTLLLRSEGVDVVATGSGCEAVDLAAGTDFDIVLTDLGLPDIPGDVVIRRVLAGFFGGKVSALTAHLLALKKALTKYADKRAVADELQRQLI